MYMRYIEGSQNFIGKLVSMCSCALGVWVANEFSNGVITLECGPSLFLKSI